MCPSELEFRRTVLKIGARSIQSQARKALILKVKEFGTVHSNGCAHDGLVGLMVQSIRFIMTYVVRFVGWPRGGHLTEVECSTSIDIVNSILYDSLITALEYTVFAMHLQMRS